MKLSDKTISFSEVNGIFAHMHICFFDLSFFFAHIYVSYWSFAFQYLRALYIKESSLLSVASLSLQTFLQFCHFSVDLACGDLFVLNLFFLVLGVMETYVV